MCKVGDGDELSAQCRITTSIIQGSGLGPTLYIILESDLHPKSCKNMLFKYADDTTLIVPENTDVSVADEFEHINSWATDC